MISGFIDKKKNGIISMAGPLANIILALIFLFLSTTNPPYKVFLNFGVLINAWLALFNLIPFGNIDGRKILAWNKFFYAAMALTAKPIMKKKSGFYTAFWQYFVISLMFLFFVRPFSK